jgi:WD40 repeat protein
VWDTESGKMVQEIKSSPEPMSLAISPDGKRLAAACQNKLLIYEIIKFQ